MRCEQEDEIEVHDIFLLPPGEDPQGCHSWLRMRNKEGRYSLMFAEYVVDEPFIVSPRVSFEVPVRILGGLMALGYTIGSLMSRVSFRVVARDVCVKWDRLEKLGAFVQVQGENRCAAVEHMIEEIAGGGARAWCGTQCAGAVVSQVAAARVQGGDQAPV